jgi:hypothetical protein
VTQNRAPVEGAGTFTLVIRYEDPAENPGPDAQPWADLERCREQGRVVLPECGTCGGPVTGWEGYGQEREVTEEPQELWPGGPVIPVPLMYPRLEITDWSYVVVGCGHPVGTLEYLVKADPSPRARFRRLRRRVVPKWGRA